MRSSLFSCIALLFATATLRAQQTADEIVAKYAQRIGGLERVHAIQSLRRTGKYYGGGGFEAQVKNENKRPNRVREEFVFGGMTGVTAYDGRAGWKIEPWQGKKDPEPLGEDETKGIVEDAAFDDPLLNYREQGNKLELVGSDQIEGTDVYKLKLTLGSNGDVRTYYLDADSGVPIKYQVLRIVRGAEREFEVELGDYKPVSGVYFPFAVAIGAKDSPTANKAQYAWERIEANVTLDERQFVKPGAAGDMPTAGDAKDAANQQPKPEPQKPAAPKKPPMTVSQSGEVLPAALAVVDSETTAGLGARNIGSAAMSGRVAAIAATKENGRLTLYVGAASGGV